VTATHLLPDKVTSDGVAGQPHIFEIPFAGQTN